MRALGFPVPFGVGIERVNLKTGLWRVVGFGRGLTMVYLDGS